MKAKTNMHQNPLVSVVMPIYEHTDQQLKRAILSILDQTYQNFELIIVDGGQGDANAKIVRSFHDKRIRYFKKIGYINCLNVGIEKSRGKYIARMDSDDVSYPDRLKVQVNFLQQHQDVCLCSCLVDYEGATLEKQSHHQKPITLLNLIKKQEIVHPAMMFRKDLNLHYDHIKPLEDCWLFRKLLLQGKKIAIIDQVLLLSHVSSTSIMDRHPDLMRCWEAKMNIWALSRYYGYSLSFAEGIFNHRHFSREQIKELLTFVCHLKRPLKEHAIKSDKLFFHFYRYMFRHCSESRYWLFFNRRYYAAFLKRDLKYACKRVLHFNKR